MAKPKPIKCDNTNVNSVSNLKIFEAHRGQGMTLLLVHTLLETVVKNPGQTVYVNFELPKALKTTVEKYSTIKRVDAEHKVNQVSHAG